MANPKPVIGDIWQYCDEITDTYLITKVYGEHVDLYNIHKGIQTERYMLKCMIDGTTRWNWKIISSLKR